MLFSRGGRWFTVVRNCCLEHTYLSNRHAALLEKKKIKPIHLPALQLPIWPYGKGSGKMVQVRFRR